MNWIEIAPFGHLRRFRSAVHDGVLMVLVGEEPIMAGGRMGWHLSISHSRGDKPGRIPSWEEIKVARYRFCPNECTMAMMLPPREEYVNLHPTTMHLHEIDTRG